MSDPLFWLGTDNYRIYHVEVARALKSINAAIFLAELANRYRYHLKKGEILNMEKHGDGWIYFTEEKCEERTALSRKNQDTAIAILENFGLIEKKVIGVPCKRHFRLNIEELNKFFRKDYSDVGQTSLTETDKLDCPKGTNCNDRNGQTGTIYIKEQKEEQKEKKIRASSAPALAPPSSSSLFKKIERAPNVRTSEDQHQELISLYGEPLLAEYYQALSDWKLTKTPSYLKSRINGDCLAIKEWVASKIEKRKEDDRKLKIQKEENAQREAALELRELQNKQIANRLSKTKPGAHAGITPSLNNDPEKRVAQGGIVITRTRYELKEAKGHDMTGYRIEGEEDGKNN